MAWRCGSLPRSLMSTARRRSTIRSSSSSSLPRLHHSSPLHAHRRSLFTNSRVLGALGCTQSLLPLHSFAAAARLTSHMSVDVRAFCELSQGT